MSVTLSAGVRQNLLSLQNTADLMSTTQNRLATGKKVNTALDNPTNFFTASSLQSRSGDLNSLLDSMSNGVKTLEAADNGLSSITKTLESMQSTLRQARQDKSFETASYTLSTIDPASAPKLTFAGGAFSAASDLSITTTGSGQYKVTTSNYAAPAAAAAATYTGAPDIVATGNTAGTLVISFGGVSATVNVTAHAAGATAHTDLRDEIIAGLTGTGLDGVVSASVNGNTIRLTGPTATDGSITVTGTAETSVFGAETSVAGSDAKFAFSVNGTAVELDTTTGANVTAAVTATNTALQAAGLKFQAFASSGKLGIRATTTDAGSLSIGGADANLFGTPDGLGVVAGTTSAALTLAKSVDTLVSSINSDTTLNTKIKASNDGGKLRIQNLSTQQLTITGANSSGQITGTTSVQSSIAGNSVRAGLADQYNALRDQLDKLSDDASFNGINLLRGDKLTLTFNETGTSSIDIQSQGGNSVDSSNLGLTIATGRTTMEAKDLDADSSIDAVVEKVKTALNTVRSQSSAFGSNLSVVENRQNFTKQMINTLQTGADNLTLADSNEEAANMLALQTRQQLASTALSLASQADQAVLRLF